MMLTGQAIARVGEAVVQREPQPPQREPQPPLRSFRKFVWLRHRRAIRRARRLRAGRPS